MHKRLCKKKLITFCAYVVLYAYTCMYLCIMHALDMLLFVNLHLGITFDPIHQSFSNMAQNDRLPHAKCINVNA